MVNNKNSLYCKGPRTTIYLRETTILGCCDTFRDVNGNYIKREDLIEMIESGNIPDNCLSCEMKVNYNMNNISDGIIDSRISFGKSCNAVCRICRFDYIINHDVKCENYDIENDEITKDFINQIANVNDNKYIKNVMLQGGEPFMYWNKLIAIIDRIETLRKGLHFILLTNGTNNNEEYYKMLSKYDIKLLISIDGDDKTQHLMRINCHMSKMKKTIELCRKYNIKFSITHTLSLLNILDFETNINYYFNELKITKDELYVHFVNTPKHYNISILPSELKHDVITQAFSMYEKYDIDISRLLKIINTNYDNIDNELDLLSFVESEKSFNLLHKTNIKEYLNKKLIDELHIEVGDDYDL